MKSYAIILLAGVSLPAASQETRGMIFGRVLDPQSSAVAGAPVTVTNRDTNAVTRLATNETGYYEASRLLPGSYEIAAEAPGFKKSIRGGIVLPVGSRLEIDLRLEVGAISESVSVTAEAPMLDTSNVSSGRILSNRTLMDIPVVANNVINLARLTTGMQTSGINPSYAMLGSVSAASDYYLPGRVGGSEYSIDGAPNNGSGRQVAYLPYSDTVQEFRVETSNFDAAQGHSAGASVSMMTRSGANTFHGTLTLQHFQQRWQGTPFFVKQNYYRRIAQAEAAGDKSLADYLRSQDKQPAGRSNNYAATIGGPVILPKLFNGKDRLFFFFSYTGLKEGKTENPEGLNYTLPTLANRQGDFSQLLNVPDAVRYLIHDPLSVRPDPARPTHYIRDPIPGNRIPRTRVINPAYDFYAKIPPTPNNEPLDPRAEPRNNYLAIGSPYIWDFHSLSNRVDANITTRHRIFGRWHLSDFLEDRSDWTYETARGLQTNGLNRLNRGATVDWVFARSSSTVLNFRFAASQFKSGNRTPVPQQYKPSDVGLPAYLDAKAGDLHILPTMSFSGYQTIGRNYPAYDRFRSYTGKADLSHIRGRHSLQSGFEARAQQRSGGGGGNTSGSFSFSNVYVRRNDDGFTPAGDLGLSWAAFMMGVPNGLNIATNDTYITGNPYFAWFAQDNWRLTTKLSVNIGLRLEHELGPTERYDRMIGYFDPLARLPISEAAESAYGRSPVPELPASSFRAQGGSVYPGVRGAGRRIYRNEFLWLPRVSAAYQLDSETVVRAGYGVYFDTINVLVTGPNQTGFSRTTSTNVTNDFGATWLAGDPRNGVSSLKDPFPVRPDGSRFDAPTRDALGLMAVAGRSFSYSRFDIRHARLRRWRAGLQRQFGANLVVEAAYAGQYSDRIPIGQTLRPLPEGYWADGLKRNDVIPANLNANVTNPFSIQNLAA
ncbi:MAG: carboxypeptidase-like regulatory domain-containing protein, partial [Acidobacteriota bacterium]